MPPGSSTWSPILRRGVVYCTALTYSLQQQLQDTDVQSLRRLRLVCRDLNAVATPACYRILEFNELLVHQNAQRAYPKTLFKHIAQFTKHVIIRSNLNPAGVRGILSFIPSLASITYVALETQVCFYPSGCELT